MATATSVKYPAPSIGATPADRTERAEHVDAAPSESRIDRDSHFNGLYETRQNLRIEGVAEGEIQCDGTLTVAEGARVKAKVTASTITIAGELEGDVVCKGVFQIMPTGQVDATVSAHRLIVQEGGLYNGEFRMIADEPGPVHSKSAPASTKRPASTPASTKEELSPTRPAGTLSTEEWWSRMTGEAPKAEPSTDGGESRAN